MAGPTSTTWEMVEQTSFDEVPVPIDRKLLAKPDRKVVACNKVVARSRSGRWIYEWKNIKHLADFRIKTLPPEHPRYHDQRINDNIAGLENMQAACSPSEGN